jgi:hypothetical protein
MTTITPTAPAAAIPETTSDAPHARGRGMVVLIVVNLIPVAASIAFALIGLLAPALLLPAGAHPSAGATYYAEFYAARALPLGVLLAAALLRTHPDSRNQGILGILLLVAGLAQIGDAVIGGTWGTTAIWGGIAAAIIHLGSIVVLSLWHRRWDPRRR